MYHGVAVPDTDILDLLAGTGTARSIFETGVKEALNDVSLPLPPPRDVMKRLRWQKPTRHQQTNSHTMESIFYPPRVAKKRAGANDEGDVIPKKVRILENGRPESNSENITRRRLTNHRAKQMRQQKASEIIEPLAKLIEKAREQRKLTTRRKQRKIVGESAVSKRHRAARSRAILDNITHNGGQTAA